MSSTNRRFVIAYILLVGLPLLGLAGILRAGRAITAPISIDGVWKVDVSATPGPAQACAQTLASLLDSSLFVSQSGKSLQLTWAGKTTVSGELEGKDITATLSMNAGCDRDQSVVLKAAVDPKSEPRSLIGSFSVVDCAACAPIQFRAVRQPRQGGGVR